MSARSVVLWIVEFACEEAVIRTGTFDEVNRPDELGCLPIRIRPIGDVRLLGMPWVKGCELRCQLAG